MSQTSRNMIVPATIGGLTLIYLYESFELPLGTAHMPDLGFVPVLFGFFVLGLCLLMIGKEIFSTQPAKDEDGNKEGRTNGPPGSQKNLIFISVAIFLYPISLVNLGFIPSTIALMFVCLWMMKFRGWFGSLVTAIAATGVAYLLFGVWLNVYLPKGILG